jgi:three-Cys-motif partner protein
MGKINKKHNFGGDWTQKKLDVLSKYLSAYTTILKKYPIYKIAYIDAFAGTGTIKNRNVDMANSSLFADEIYNDTDAQEYINGSAKISLTVQPQFDKYIFIELEPNKAKSLQDIIENEFNHLKDKIKIENKDSNIVLRDLCNKDWQKHRALVFLDPYAMEAEWDTIQAIAKTKAIDLWILFPLGVSVNRLLMKNRNEIPENWSKALDKLFGTHDWYNEFYETKINISLFSEEEVTSKTATFDRIANFYIKRLKTIFVGVLDEPLYLYNSTNNPLFLLCFAAGNPKGADTAIKIARDIIGKINEPKN